MRWYTPHEPPASLARFLACSWTATPTGRHLLVPDACMDLVWMSTGDLWVCGPETRSWEFQLPHGMTSCGVRFRPGVGPAALGVPATALVEIRTRLGHVFGGEIEATLRGELTEAGGLERQRKTLVAFTAGLVERMSDDRGADIDFSDCVLDVLASTSQANAAKLAESMGVTVRHLLRRSQISFGYGPSTLARLLRLQRFLALSTDAAAFPHRSRLARLAIDAGYSDQAHLARDCRAITGRTPSRLLADYFPTFPDMSDPFKTSTPFAIKMFA